ncbi:hypothetical protein BVX95_00830 [archaeon D22]|nr:hypothetical protein BVX95_00830 [archaeon D22]
MSTIDRTSSLDERIENLKRGDLWFKNEFDWLIDEWYKLDSSKRANEKAGKLLEIVTTANPCLESLDVKYLLAMSSNLEEMLVKFVYEPQKEIPFINLESPDNPSRRDNGFTYMVTHWLNVQKILGEVGASEVTRFAGFNHDYIEEMIELAGLKYANSKDKAKMLSEVVALIRPYWQSAGVESDDMVDLLSRVTRLEIGKTRQDYQEDVRSLFGVKEQTRERDIINAYRAAQIKLADGIDNVQNMRPNSPPFEDLLDLLFEREYDKKRSDSLICSREFVSDFFEGNDMSKYSSKKEQFGGFHNVVFSEVGEQNSRFLFSTGGPEYIFKNVFKRALLIDELNGFLEEYAPDKTQDIDDGTKAVISKEYETTLKLKKKLIAETKKELEYSMSHLLNYHISVEDATHILSTVQERGEEYYQEVTLGGPILSTFDNLIGKNKQGLLGKKIIRELNEPENNPDAYKDRFKGYADLYKVICNYEKEGFRLKGL